MALVGLGVWTCPGTAPCDESARPRGVCAVLRCFVSRGLRGELYWSLLVVAWRSAARASVAHGVGLRTLRPSALTRLGHAGAVTVPVPNTSKPGMGIRRSWFLNALLRYTSPIAPPIACHPQPRGVSSLAGWY